MGDMGCVLLGYVVVIVRELCERGERGDNKSTEHGVRVS